MVAPDYSVRYALNLRATMPFRCCAQIVPACLTLALLDHLPRLVAAASRSPGLLPGMGADEARVRAIAEVVSLLVAGVREGRDVDLNQLKCEVRGR